MRCTKYAVAWYDYNSKDEVLLEFVDAISENDAMIIILTELLDPRSLIASNLDFTKDPPNEIANHFSYDITARRCPNAS
jgi:hypothetical protein